MAKPLGKRIEKGLKKGTDKAEKALAKIHLGGKKKQPIATAAGVAIAGAVGVATVVHLLRRGHRNAARFEVVQQSDGEWAVTVEGADKPVGLFGTKREAVSAGRTAARDAAPSDLVIHTGEGTVQATHEYAQSAPA